MGRLRLLRHWRLAEKEAMREERDGTRDQEVDKRRQSRVLPEGPCVGNRHRATALNRQQHRPQGHVRACLVRKIRKQDHTWASEMQLQKDRRASVSPQESGSGVIIVDRVHVPRQPLRHSPLDLLSSSVSSRAVQFLVHKTDREVQPLRTSLAEVVGVWIHRSVIGDFDLESRMAGHGANRLQVRACFENVIDNDLELLHAWCEELARERAQRSTWLRCVDAESPRRV